jgi:hypothetical protein
MQQLAKFAQEGATVIFEKLPEDVPGYGRLETRRGEFKAALGRLGNRATVQADVLAALAAKGASREAIADSGVSFIRRASTAGHDYFFTNLTAKAFEGWATLGTAARTAAILDPLTGTLGGASLKAGDAGKAQVYLQLAPGESLIVRTTANATAAPAKAWAYREVAGAPVAITGNWAISFTKGGPELPAARQTAALKSWTEIGSDEAVQRFGGTARYRIEFDAPTTRAEDWLLDLGDVRESARVRLNGREVTTAWSILRPGRNVLELDVTNLAANRIRDMDKKGEKWKIMYEINFVNINYRPFDASGWDLTPSGLLGPVTLTPLRSPKI